MRALQLGEVALRVRDLDAMEAFYRDVIGLEVMRRFGDAAVCFRVAEGFAGHTQVLFLFRRPDTEYTDTCGVARRAVDTPGTTLDHVAFSIALEDFAPEKARLEALGLTVETLEHRWVQWRSLYVADPEGNLVEFVCRDPSVPAE